MALLFMDGFDHYLTANLSKKYSSLSGGPDIQGSIYRNGTGALQVYNNEGCRIDGIGNQTTLIFGMAYYPITALYNSWMLYFYDITAGQYQVLIRMTTAGGLQAYRNTGTLLGSSDDAVISLATWNYIETKVYIHNSAGTVNIRVNGVDVLNLTSQDTQYSTNQWVNSLIFAGTAGNTYIDDLYLLDDTGSTNNDFLGNVKVETLYPDGDGNESDWTPSTGSNWQNVDDATPDDDSTYNYVGSGAGFPMNDLYTLDNLTTVQGDVFGIQVNSYVRKDDAGSVNLASIVRTGGTTYSGMGVASISDTYDYQRDILEENPDTATAWTISNINGLETGIRRVS